MQVISNISDSGIEVNDDPTHKKEPWFIDRSQFEKAYNAIKARSALPRGDLVNLVGSKNSEFIIVMFDLLDDFTYDNFVISVN